MGTHTGEGSLAASDAAMLAQALVDFVSVSAGIRAIALKGEVANHWRVRPARASSDADVWVHPESLTDLVHLLGGYGWTARPSSKLADRLAGHSVTLISEQWPCDIDLHGRFPGFLSAPEEVFDALWDRREAIDIAGRSVNSVDLPGSILIGALHGLRSPLQDERHGREVRYLAEVVIPNLEEARFRDLVDLAVKVGAADTARPVFCRRSKGLPSVTPARVDPNLDAWRFRVGGGGSTPVQALQLLTQSTWRERPSVLREVLWRSPSDLALDRPGGSNDGFRRVGHRLGRIVQGLRSIRGVVRGFKLARTGRTDESLVDGRVPW